jgi:hypothetical protein
MVPGRGEHAEQMLVKADAGFPGDAREVGIESLKKILDLPLNLHTAR